MRRRSRDVHQEARRWRRGNPCSRLPSPRRCNFHCTVKIATAECAMPTPTPRMLSEYVASGADCREDMVRVVVPELLIDAGLNDERAPDGNPVRLRRIVAINEPRGLMLLCTTSLTLEPRFGWLKQSKSRNPTLQV